MSLSLRTKNRRQQRRVRLALAIALLALYALAAMALGLGNPAHFWGHAQMRAFLPTLVLFGILAYETRWDGIARKEEYETEIETKADPEMKAEVVSEVEGGKSVVVSSCSGRKEENLHSATTTQNYNFSNPQPPIFQPPPPPPTSSLPPSTSFTPAEAWEAARAMPHSAVPDPVQERDYYALVVQAANGGHVDALLKLSEYARKRGANVEAYYWAAVAQKRGAKGLDGRMGEIRKNWLFNAANGEYENVYEFFPETCGTIARSLLRIACSIDAPYARQRLRELASFGDVHAKLFC